LKKKNAKAVPKRKPRVKRKVEKA